jgi:4-amino-4-deoxy-L-arabinose transferase-like glycosyltransferase
MVSKESIKKTHDTGVILLLLLVFCISSIPLLNIFPKVWMDEAWDSTTAYSFQKFGTFQNSTLVSPSLGNQDIHFLQPRIISNVIMAPFYAILGVGSVQGRLASVFVGALAVIGIYLLTRRIGNQLFASICTLLFIVDNLFFVVTRTIRPEVYLVAITIWTLFIILNTGTSFIKLFICGILLGISLYIHPNAFLVLISILIIAFSKVKPNQYFQILFPLILGIILGFLPYALYVIFQDGANHFQDFWLQIHNRAEMLKNPITYISTAIKAEVERYISYIYFPYRFPIFLIQILAIIYAIIKRADKVNRAFLIFIFVHVVLFPILISAKTSRYLIVLMPALTILVIKMIWDLAGWSYDISVQEIKTHITKLNKNILVPVALALIIFINQTGGDFWAVWKSRDCSFPPFISQVRSLVPKGAKTWGPMTYWFGFYDYPYRTQWTVTTEAEMNEYQPEYAILYDNSEI